jgi:hypothetical protein
MFIVVVVVVSTASAAPLRGLEAVSSPNHPKFVVHVDCERPKSDLSDLLSAGYRAVAQPDSFNHVSFFSR